MTHPTRSFLTLLTVALALALAAATASAAALAPPAKQILRVGTGAFAEEGRLDVQAASYVETISVARIVLEPLYRVSASGTIVPVLASGPPRVTQGGRVVTVPLRPARWSDGRPITGRDVATALAYARNPRNNGYA